MAHAPRRPAGPRSVPAGVAQRRDGEGPGGSPGLRTAGRGHQRRGHAGGAAGREGRSAPATRRSGGDRPRHPAAARRRRAARGPVTLRPRPGGRLRGGAHEPPAPAALPRGAAMMTLRPLVTGILLLLPTLPCAAAAAGPVAAQTSAGQDEVVAVIHL